MPAKAPMYLKNGYGDGKGGKKLREILSTEMISLPLGDFRHTAHVGRGGSKDMFGDTKFLSKVDDKPAPPSVPPPPPPSAQNRATTPVKVTGPGKGSVSSVKSSGSDQSSDHTGSLLRKGKKMAIWRSGSMKKRNLSSSDQDDSTSLPPSEHQSPTSVNSYAGVNNTSKDSNKPMQNAVSLPHLLHDSELSLPQDTKEKKGRKGKKKKGKKYDSVGESIPATSSEERGLDIEPETVREQFAPTPCVLDSNGYPASPRNAEDNLSLFEGWEIDLNLDTGSSMLDDVIGVMDKIEL